MPTINIIGLGKVGLTFFHLFAKHIQAVYNRTAKPIVITSKHVSNDLSIMKLADINIITTSDDAITKIVDMLCDSHGSLQGQIFLHCSGALSCEVLAPLREKGAFIASLHPMRSFADPIISAQNFSGTFCAMEGDDKALQVITPVFQEIGANIYIINKDKKVPYHIAGVLLSNSLAALASMAKQLLTDAAVPSEIVNQVILSLLQGVLDNLSANIDNPELTLTGPLQRGDVGTLQKHKNYLQHHDPKLLQYYNALASYIIDSTQPSKEKAEILRKILGLAQ